MLSLVSLSVCRKRVKRPIQNLFLGAIRSGIYIQNSPTTTEPLPSEFRTEKGKRKAEYAKGKHDVAEMKVGMPSSATIFMDILEKETEKKS